MQKVINYNILKLLIKSIIYIDIEIINISNNENVV